MGGTRDFLPEAMLRREYVIHTLKQIFGKYGFLPLETPTIERWETLAGKYGEEGEKLIYHVVSSGSLEELQPGKRTDLALRYDLTVPLARVVGMYGDKMVPDPANPKRQIRLLPRPFKRYQIQPVWRGDRPGAGRYREFYQCDADVVGSDSLLVEAELIALKVEAFKALGFADFTVKINHRQLLAGLIAWAGIPAAQEATVLSSIDKLDKLPAQKVKAELTGKGLDAGQIDALFGVIELEGSGLGLLAAAGERLAGSAAAGEGIGDLKKLLGYLDRFSVDPAHYRIDLSLARGLDYYTGTIFETVTSAQVGSVGAGGRYDKLIHTLSGGRADQPACGISFGLDRIYAAMEELGLLTQVTGSTQVLVLNFSDPGIEEVTFNLVRELRTGGIRTELGYNEENFTPNGMRAQLGYANEKQVAYAVIVGPDELAGGVALLRDLATRKQERLPLAEVAGELTRRLGP
ncbi:histidyl-tRNA synthetase [Gloeobacter kilaueensis JS1]|uniref:Histidine--tRNA ligase n=2 Tax=Gloeobacter TaxID=33071 RepID=U5QKU2_GLOK1|nr:histidyl-tRNA synthetase [Gloeobacter kilaueensis JS1]